MSETNVKATGRRRLVIALLFGAVAVAAIVWSTTRPSREERLRSAQSAIAARQFGRAAEILKELLEEDGGDPELNFLAASVARSERLFQEGLRFLAAIPDEGEFSVEARVLAGEIELFDRHRLTAAESQFRRALALSPDHPEALNSLAYIMSVELRDAESEQLILRMIQAGHFELVHLSLMVLGTERMYDAAAVREFYSAAPDDPGAKLAQAHSASLDGDFETAEKLLRSVVKDSPDWLSAVERLGRLYLNQIDLKKFDAWDADNRRQHRRSAEIWLMRSERARLERNEAGALRCLYECIRLNPNHREGFYQLGRTLVSLGILDDANRFLERAQQLREYEDAVKNSWNTEDEGEMRKAAQLARSLGLPWDAYGWNVELALRHPDDDRYAANLAEFDSQRETVARGRTSPRILREFQLDVTDYPLPYPDADVDRPRDETTTPRKTEIRFDDVAASLGIDFQYFNSGKPAESLLAMYEVLGGGVGVLDYDLDGRCDLYFPQGRPWETTSTHAPMGDKLFRNRGGRFQDVSVAAAVFELNFSHGAAVSDLNLDGFPDVLVTNIGRNTLWINNGDGTFDDATSAAGLSDESSWSTSCAVADYNRDGNPDIYVVNYLQGDDVFDRICTGPGGARRSCQPQIFSAAPDHLYLNLGDGRFRLETRAADADPKFGKGLGVAAADFTGDGMLDLFVANDVSPNYLLVNHTDPGSARIVFRDEALLRGLAVNREGAEEACMGVAVGDVDSDGLVDLFVTNFENESNTIYRQSMDGLFRDWTIQSQLDAPSRELLGFGTQFIDCELDGDLDLVVVNGHVNNLHTPGRPFQMPAQLFVNRGDGTFDEGAGAGEFFEATRLGRGLARLDWNADGREDFVVSYLDSPAALVTNRTQSAGNWLSLTLIGVASSRIPVGAGVTIRIGNRSYKQWLTAGDGYLSSNAATLHFGVGSATVVDRLTIDWPDGPTTTAEQIHVNRHYVAVEDKHDVQTFDAQ